MKLKADPLGIFEEDDSPIALHARRRWMDGAGRAGLLARETVMQIGSTQSADGSWDGSVSSTIRNLFSLWLLAGLDSRVITKALDWLLEVDHPPMKQERENGATYDGMFFRTTRRDREELRRPQPVPFTPGCSGFVKTGAALFFAGQFGRGDDERVRKAFSSINRTARARQGRLCTGSCASNIHIAMAAHPQERRSEGMKAVLAYLSGKQKPIGSWEDGIPFFPTLWMLSYLNSRAANAAFRLALGRVQRSQSRDGYWGRSRKQLDSFLVLDSLSQKGLFPQK
jgi:hypothetical protein